MTILVLGINHKTAPISLREKVAFSDEKRALAMQQTLQNEWIESIVILSTCNRTEIYFHNKKIPPQTDNGKNIQWQQDCLQWFTALYELPLHDLQPYIYVKQNVAAVIYLMQVCCGLDSLIFGEVQILGQVKRSYQHSEQFYHQHGLAISSEFSRLFEKAFLTAKNVRTNTEVGSNSVSVAYATCSLARQIFDSLSHLHVLLVGAGETIELVSRYLLQHNVGRLILANRTLKRAQALSRKLGNMDILSLDQLQQGLNQADIVITATASSEILITAEMVEIAQKKRRNLPMLIIDIAIPRDVDENVSKIDTVYHYDVDDLHNIIQHNLTQRQNASVQANEIIEQECKGYFNWLKMHQSSNLIRSYREQAEKTRQQLLTKALSSLQLGQNPEQILQELSYKLTNRLLHQPTQVMQKMVEMGDTEGLQNFSASINNDNIDNGKFYKES